MTAGDAGRPDRGWVPLEPPTPPPSPAPPDDPPTQPVTRASMRQAREAALHRYAAGWVATDSPSRGVLVFTAVAAVAVAVLVGLSALVSPERTAIAVGFTSVVMVWGWGRLTAAPSPRVGGVVLGLGVLAVCATAGLTRTEPYLVWVPVTVAVSVIAAFLHQVLRKGGRPRLTAGIVGSVGALAITASGAAMVPLPWYPHGASWVLMAMVSVAAASLALPLTAGHLAGLWVVVPVLVLGIGGAITIALQQSGIPLLGAVLAGVLAPAVTHSLQRVLLGLPGSRGAQAAVGAGAASVLVVGVIVYLLARLYAG